MSKTISLCPQTLQVLRRVDERLMSYNIEITEVTGGTFWKAYSPEQIAGKEPFPPVKDFSQVAGLMQVYDPIDLYNPKLRALSKAFGPVWIRVSGSWATKTYYDFDGHTNGVVPEGYQSILTKDQWIGLLDFVKSMDAKLLVSIANCEGLHAAHEPWNPSQAKVLFDFSRDYGVPINAAEFMNEPNMLATSGAPAGYTPADYVRDQDIFNQWVKESYPDVLIVGPCSTGDEESEESKQGGGGCTWASTYLDVFRTLIELGSFALVSDGVIFHNTLASSDYGFLAHSVFDPRPNYFAVLLWNRLMGNVVYDVGIPPQEGLHVYAHSRKDGKDGVVYLLVNNSTTESTSVEIPGRAERYTLSADTLRATTMKLNDRPLVLGPDCELPDLSAVEQPAGMLKLAPATCTFLVL